MPRPHRVLVVDDTDDSRQLASFVLERAGFAVTEAATGAEALRLAGTAAVDVIVLDVHLPDIDGFEVCRRLKAEPAARSIPVFFLSATYTDLQARARGRESGAEGYLTKPCDPVELVSAVENLARLRDAELALGTRDSLVSDLERAQEALRERELQLRNLGDNLRTASSTRSSADSTARTTSPT